MRVCSAFFLIEPISCLKSSTGVVFARTLYLKILGQIPFSKWFLRKPMELFELVILSCIELSSSSWQNLFMSVLFSAQTVALVAQVALSFFRLFKYRGPVAQKTG